MSLSAEIFTRATPEPGPETDPAAFGNGSLELGKLLLRRAAIVFVQARAATEDCAESDPARAGEPMAGLRELAGSCRLFLELIALLPERFYLTSKFRTSTDRVDGIDWPGIENRPIWEGSEARGRNRCHCLADCFQVDGKRKSELHLGLGNA